MEKISPLEIESGDNAKRIPLLLRILAQSGVYMVAQLASCGRDVPRALGAVNRRNCINV